MKKLPKPPLTMSRIKVYAQLLEKKLFLGMFTILKHREPHLDDPWPVNELRTAQWLRAGHTGRFSRSREQPHCQILFLGKTPGTTFPALDQLPQSSRVVSSSPLPAQLWIQYF